MSTLLSASVPTEEFVLAETFERVPAVEFDALRLVGDGAEGDIPLLRARGAETSRVRDALEGDS
ncbi:DNA-binding protein, partial [Halobacteriales archaeon QH_7_68_42]